jgi:hypothetical protein
MKWALSTIFFTLVPAIVDGATYYVAKTGSDNYSCRQAQSASTPKVTIAAGLACLNNGDTLIIKNGTYEESINHNQIPAGRGSWNSATTIMAASGETVLVQPKTGGKAGDAVWIYRNYIILDGFIIDAVNVTVHGIRINNGASHVIIRNMEVKNAPRFGCIAIKSAQSTDVQVVNSRLHHCGTTNQDHGVYLRGSNHLVERNEIYNNSGHGVHQWNKRQSKNDHNIVRYNSIHDNGSRGILIGSGQSNEAYGNIVWNNRTSGIVVGFNSPKNNLVYGNTIYSNGGHCIDVRSGSAHSVIDNNICWQNKVDKVRDEGHTSAITDTWVTNDFLKATTTPPVLP